MSLLATLLLYGSYRVRKVLANSEKISVQSCNYVYSDLLCLVS